MAKRGQQSILIGDCVRSYAWPGLSDCEYITGTVVGYCQIAGLPRLIIEAESRTIRGQLDPCRRRFLEPLDGVTKISGVPQHPLKRHSIA
jgi:hypothetical protein